MAESPMTDKEFQQVQTAPVDRQGKKAKGRTANRDLMQRRFELDQQEEEPAKKQTKGDYNKLKLLYNLYKRGDLGGE